MLGCVHPESGNANVDQVVEVLGHLVPHIVGCPVEVGESHQVAVPHDVGVAVVVHTAASRGTKFPRGEVLVRIGHCREVVVAVHRVETGPSRPGALPVHPSHVVDHGIHEDPHPHPVAPLHHVLELGTTSRTGVEVVGHRLVPLPPGKLVLGKDHMLVRGRHLDPTITHRT